MDLTDKELQHYARDFCEKLTVLPFDNTKFTLCVNQLRKQLDQHILLSEDADKAWLASKTVIELLQAQHEVLTQKCDAALDQARLTQNQFETALI